MICLSSFTGVIFYFLWRELCHGHMGKGAFRPVGYSSGDKRHVAQGQQGLQAGQAVNGYIGR